MKKYTQKQLREMTRTGEALNITNYRQDGYDIVKTAEGSWTQIGYCSGIYGLSGKLLKGDTTHTLYAIYANTPALYMF